MYISVGGRNERIVWVWKEFRLGEGSLAECRASIDTTLPPDRRLLSVLVTEQMIRKHLKR